MQSLDRFSVGMLDPQEAREVGECGHCHYQIYEGHEAIKHDGELFCDEYCLKESLLENAVFEEIIA